MSSRYAQISCVLLLCLLLSISAALSGCKKSRSDEPEQPVDDERLAGTNETIVLQTDSDEWRVQLFKEHLLYSEAVAVKLPAPWTIPTKAEADVLHLLEYPHEERFVTIDGYTFGMPSKSVSKAGQKTQYSVLGLYRRRKVYDVPF